mmetsp:Transcript_40491/g.63530  ORF Transcript_40491/g.63530 Transcript_40491/m.63530 type:complete len:235 (+) Transcript_40491:131-835(+)
MALLVILVAPIEALLPTLTLGATTHVADTISAQDPGIPFLHIVLNSWRCLHHLALLDGLGDLSQDEFNRPGVGGVGGNWNVDEGWIVVGIHHTHARHADTGHLGDWQPLLGLVHKNADVRIGGHVDNTSVLLLQAVQLALIEEALEITHTSPGVLSLLFPKLLHELHGFANDREVAHHTSHKPKIAVVTVCFLSVFRHLLTGLLLGTNHHETGSLSSCLHAVVAGTIQVRSGLN